MEWKTLFEQEKQDLGEKDIQIEEKELKKPRGKRSAEAKIGRLKYHEVLTKEVHEQNKQILTQLRWVRHRLEKIGEANYDGSTVEGFAVQDQVDREILQRVREAGDLGVFPKDVAEYVNGLGGYGLKYYDVSRRVVRMNKRLYFETGKLLFEKRGHRWALTRFAFDVYGATDLEDARSNLSESVEEVKGF